MDSERKILCLKKPQNKGKIVTTNELFRAAVNKIISQDIFTIYKTVYDIVYVNEMSANKLSRTCVYLGKKFMENG